MLSRNAEISNFGVPTLDYNRNAIDKEYNHKGTCYSGDLVPFYINTLINPGETVKMNMSLVCRMLTPEFPVMDNAYLDVYFFSDTWLDLWEHSKEFFGENLMEPFQSATEYTIPIIKNGTGGNATLGLNTILDHLGGLAYGQGFESDRFGLNAYLRVYNYNFRDQNLIAPITVDTSDADVTYDASDPAKGGTLLKVAKSHDYFTSALLEPIKGVALSMPIGTSAPIKGNGKTLGLTDGTHNIGIAWASGTGAVFRDGGFNVNLGTATGTTNNASSNVGIGVTTDSSKSGMIADLSQSIGTSLLAQRPVIAMTQIQEKMMMMGSRYKEFVRWGFGVTSPSLSLHEPKYLGGKRIPINIETTLDTTTSGLGETGAFSITADVDYMFTESFDQHSVILGVMCIRTDQTYSQGIDCQHSKRRRYDYYHNELRGLGMQPIYNKEIMKTGTNDDLVWGYKPAWQEYRTEINHVTGLMRPDAPQSLSKWTYANNFSSRPSLNQAFIEQSADNVKNTLKVQNQPQFFFDINLQYTLVTEIPLFAPIGLDRM